MIRRLLPYTYIYALLIIFITAAVIPIVAIADSYQSYPPSGSTGSVTGRVTNATTGSGISGATVIIANASDNSVQYGSTTTDSNGDFILAGASTTNGSASYQLLVSADHYLRTSSNPFSVSSGTSTVNVGMQWDSNSAATPTATTTTGQSSPPSPSSSANLRPGDVAGYVTSNGTSISGATVSLVGAANPYYVYKNTTTDSSGYFKLDNVQIISAPGYRLHVVKDGYNEKFSTPFVINGSSIMMTNVSLTVFSGINKSDNLTSLNGSNNTSANGTPSAKPRKSGGLLSIPGFEVFLGISGIAAGAASCTIRRRK
ncbi:MAG TPA: carboxypeptidase-like regulatory domain-containing protein [Methanocella sp.]|nr:carboxypeptidase-like regulatory domain-containing protein [Methanocella sp.]